MMNEKEIGIFTTDTQLRIRTWDAWLENATGVPRDAAKGQLLATLFPDIVSRGLLRRFENVLHEGVVEVLSPAFHRYLISCTPLAPSKYFERMQQHVTIAALMEGNSVTGIIITIEDVTSRLDHERRIAEKLTSDNENDRLFAAHTLASGETLEEAQPLVGALKDESWRVRKVAVDGLKKHAGQETIGSILSAIRNEHDNANVLNSAIQVLTMSDLDVITPLTGFLKSEDVELRSYAALILGEIKDLRAIPALIESLDDSDMNVRYHAIEALGKTGAIGAVDSLMEIIEKRDFFLAFPALDALMNIGDMSIAARLVPLLEDEMLQSPAADALGQLGDEDAILPLISLLEKPDGPVITIIKAIASIFDRFNRLYGEGIHISDLVRHSIHETGVQNILHALNEAGDDQVGQIALILGWLEGKAIDEALTRLLGKPTARREVVDAIVSHGYKIVDLLIEQLDVDDMEIRKAAIIALGRIGDARAVSALVRNLTEDAELAIVAAGALAKIGDRSVFDALIGLIGYHDVAVRQAVISALNSIGHPDMAKLIKVLLSDQDEHVRESAAKITGYFGYQECVDLLIERCNDAGENVRYVAIQNIAFVEDERIIPILVQALQKDTPKVRAAAAYALGQVDDKSVLPHLLLAVHDGDPWVRYFVAKSMGNYGSPELLDTLSNLALKDSANHVRIAAVEAIGKTGGVHAVSILAQIMNEDNFDLSRTAINALGGIGHTDAMDLLISALHSLEPVKRIEAVRALGRRGGVDAVNALGWVAGAERQTNIVLEAIEALCQIGTREAVTALIELTVDREKRDVCIPKLSEFKGRYIEWIADGLNHVSPAVRHSIVDVLARMKHPDATEALSKSLEDPDASVRLAAVNALVYLGSRYADRKLAALARSDHDAGVRHAAGKALKR